MTSLARPFRPSFNPVPKIRDGQVTRAQQKDAERRRERAEERACYRLVDLRDKYICRVCKRQTTPSKKAPLDKRTIRHHIVYRSKTSEPHRPENVVTICKFCNDEIHVTGRMHMEGDAEQRDPITGKLNGVRVDRLTESGWRVEKWV